MKNSKTIVWIALTTAIIFSFSVCDNGSTSKSSTENPVEETENPFEGTWYGYDPGGERVRLSVGSSDWTMSWPDNDDPDGKSLSGLYSYTGKRAVITDWDSYGMGYANVSDLNMTVFITGTGRFVFVKPVKPPSVDDFADLEPDMTQNTNRVKARLDKPTQIGIPDILSGLTGPVTFEIDPADADIADISPNGIVTGKKLGSARIKVERDGQTATVTVAVTPNLPSFTLPADQVKTLGAGNASVPWWSATRPDSSLPNDLQDYKSEPSYQLAWNWRNPNQSLGASGTNCGIDILAYFVDPANGNNRGFVRTTFGNGGWHYDLNGVTNTMTDGVQVNGSVELKLQPEFYYDNGVPYLQITHILTNKGSARVTGQKFGASADVMIYGQDSAPLTHLQYGALMTNATSSAPPSLKYRLVCQNVQGVDDVSTLWLGRFGSERDYVYVDQRDDIANTDSALNFSYQNIDLNAGESKRFVVRFTQVQ
jgi:hypothetical protein